MSEDVSSRIAALTPAQRAYLALKEMQGKLDELERARNEAIAVVGIGCRLPGGSDSPDNFWKLLHNGVDAIVEVPADRYDVDEFFDPDLATAGSMNTRWGGFLKNIADFDAGFFGISVREASSIDPQQRLLLEASWEAIENAGLSADRLAGSATGVFMGMSCWDYSSIHLEAPLRGATGLAFSIAANRLSYFYDFHGPSLVADSACSSSLVALDLACQNLRNGDIDVALAGGVNALLYPYVTVSLSQAGFLSSDGRCKTFDESANGYVRGEGCGVVVLKRLSDAIAKGHHIYGVIRSAAVNQDGRSNGLTAPNGLAQQSVLRKALKKARLKPEQISYVEAHGTGTSLGDVVEVESLWAVLGEGRAQDNVLRLGSVKTNIGHIEPASGVAGLIKVLLALDHEEIPPHLNLKKINPSLNMDSRLQIPLSPSPWRRSDVPRYAGLSAFGFGGTNAHVIIEEAPLPAAVTATVDRPLHLLTLSARTGAALAEMARRYSAALAGQPDARLADVCYTANTGRVAFEHRLAVIAASFAEVRERLDAFASGSSSTSEWHGIAKNQGRSRIAFSFAGDGVEYGGPARRLYDTQPTFRKAIDGCDELLRNEFGRSILPLGEGGLMQPALFAVDYAMGQLWQSWGVVPSATMGQRVGEFVAACAAGVLDWQDALRVVADSGKVNSISFKAPQVPLVSRLTGQWLEAGFVPDAAYWSGPAVPPQAPVGFDKVLEIRPGPSQGAWQTMLSELASLYVSGVPVDWSGFDRDYPRRLVTLPTYPFERKQCWIEPAEMRAFPGPFSKVEA